MCELGSQKYGAANFGSQKLESRTVFKLNVNFDFFIIQNFT
jgi:hypothetical protein